VIVDVHGHLAVPEADALLADEPGLAAEREAERAAFTQHSRNVNLAQLERVKPRLTDPARRIRDLDAMSVDVQLVGPMPMHHYWADRGLAVRFARTVNDAVAEHCRHSPDRLVGLATIPLQHPDIAVSELGRAVTQLGLKGIAVSTYVNGRELSDPAHEPIWETAAALGAVVFVHPWGCTLGERLAADFLANTVGQPAETTLALSRIIFAGVLDRHPNLRLLAAHGGGYLPTYIGRSDHAWQVRPDAHGCAETPSAYLKRIWYDSLVYTPRALEHLVEAAGADRVMLGTDHPFDMGVSDPVERICAARLTDAQRDAVLGANAAALLGLNPEGRPERQLEGRPER
jgi:aminocarboxymuconate-semialdehyde decarboxylase